jgi:hypothetical protein
MDDMADQEIPRQAETGKGVSQFAWTELNLHTPEDGTPNRKPCQRNSDIDPFG